MSTLKLPEIINISKATETKSKNFILHLTKAQWKKTMSKAVIYKGKKKFSEFVKIAFSYSEIDGLEGGLLTTYSINKNGMKFGLFPVVVINNNKKIILFKKRGAPGGPVLYPGCQTGCVGGSLTCIGSCNSGKTCLSLIDPYTNTLSGCMCNELARY